MSLGIEVYDFREGIRLIPGVIVLKKPFYQDITRLNIVDGKESRDLLLRNKKEFVGELYQNQHTLGHNCFYLKDFYIHPSLRNRKIGKELLTKFEEDILSNSGIGILFNNIPIEDDTLHFMYSRHGWKNIMDHSCWMSFNSENANTKELSDFVKMARHLEGLKNEC